MNYTDISSILKRELPEEYADKIPVLSVETQALQLLSEGKTLVEVAITLNASSEDVIQYYKRYLRLKLMYSIVNMLDIHKDELRSLLLLLREVKRSGLGLKGATLALRNKSELVTTKRELESFKLQLAYKMNERATMELARIPEVNNPCYTRTSSHRRF